MNKQIKNAIERSISHDEIVSISVLGMSAKQLLDEVDAFCPDENEDGEYLYIDYRSLYDNGSHSIDVWAAPKDSNKMAWRLNVTTTEEQK